jgi:hypothetical protein
LQDTRFSYVYATITGRHIVIELQMKRVLLLVFLLVVISVAAVWTTRYFRRLNLRESADRVASLTNTATVQPWTAAVEQVKADRGEAMGGGAAVQTPAELKHYSERYWFLATQIAEVAQHNIPTCQDYFDLAFMIQRGDLVSVPGVTETYVLFGVAQRADESAFTRDENVSAAGGYESLYALAKNFGGRSYNLNDPADRRVLKGNLLSSLRPPALKILEEVAASYHQQFDRPLPVSSLVRPEQYQHSLNRVNRNAVLIETPPHSTGLAFDIDYRYMSGAEQAFVMAELALMKSAGRIEAIRERNANYHVFAFIDGARPNDELISASLDEAMPQGRDAHHPQAKAKPKSKSKPVRQRNKRKRGR